MPMSGDERKEFSAFSASVTDIKSSMEDLTSLVKSLAVDMKSLNSTTTQFSSQLSEVKVELQRDINCLSERIDEELVELRSSNASINERITDVVNKLDVKVENIHKDLVNRIDEVDGKTKRFHDLDAAIKTIAEQQKHIVSLEKSTHNGLQHGRAWNIEIDGIPAAIGDHPDQLEEAALKIIRGINVDIEDYEIDTIHRLPSKQSPKPTIIRFVSRKTSRAVHENKHKLRHLKDLDLDIAGLREDSKIFIRASQCPYYRTLGYNCRLLKRSNLISKIFTSKEGKLSIKTLDNTKVNISHATDLTGLFPDFPKFNFSYDERHQDENE